MIALRTYFVYHFLLSNHGKAMDQALNNILTQLKRNHLRCVASVISRKRFTYEVLSVRGMIIHRKVGRLVLEATGTTNQY